MANHYLSKILILSINCSRYTAEIVNFTLDAKDASFFQDASSQAYQTRI